MKFSLLLNNKLLISTCTVIFLFILAEYEFFNAHKYENAYISWHFIYPNVDIFIFISTENFMLSQVEHKNVY